MFSRPIKMLPPSNFSWLEDRQVACFGLPSLKQHFEFLAKKNIFNIISLTETLPDLPIEEADERFRMHHIPIRDFTAPTFDQIEEAVSLIEKKKHLNQVYDNITGLLQESDRLGLPIGIHCKKGCGRTGTIAAIYIAIHQRMCAREAIAKIREMRPGSIETLEQEETVVNYILNLSNRNCS